MASGLSTGKCSSYNHKRSDPKTSDECSSGSCPNAGKRQRRDNRRGLQTPRLSNGWLAPFNARMNNTRHGQLGETGGITREDEQDMVSLRQALKSYNPKDQFSVSETYILWKQTPVQNQRFPARQYSSREKEDPKISALLCYNSDGSEKLDPWFIGSAKTPRAFKAAGINIQNFNLVWRGNLKAYITSSLFAEFIYWFDKKMTDRKVALILDNRFASHAILEGILPGQAQLRNTLIVWLPGGCYRSFDEGIINSWKLHWKHHWIQYIICELEANRSPMSTMDVLKAVRWGLQSWSYGVSIEIIQNCFHKSLYPSMPHKYFVNEAIMEDIRFRFSKLQELLPAHELVDIGTFLHPDEETTRNVLEDIDNTTFSQYIPVSEENSEEELEILQKVSIEEAFDAFHRLRLFEEQQEEGSPEFLRALDEHENVLRGRKFGPQSHSNI